MQLIADRKHTNEIWMFWTSVTHIKMAVLASEETQVVPQNETLGKWAEGEVWLNFCCLLSSKGDFLKKPILTVVGSSKLPVNVRQSCLEKIFTECCNLYDEAQDAKDRVSAKMW